MEMYHDLIIAGAILFGILILTLIIRSKVRAKKKRDAALAAWKLECKKDEFLSKNASFAGIVIERIFRTDSSENCWILTQGSTEETTVRTLFIGYKDIYCFHGIPRVRQYNGTPDTPYPQTWRLVERDMPPFRYTHRHYTYGDSFDHAPISDYNGTPKEDVLGWVAENICQKFKEQFPLLSASKVKRTEWPDDYYYFTYHVPNKTVTGWN
jgi:hypothetical protein